METVGFVLSGDEDGPELLVEMEMRDAGGEVDFERAGLSDLVSRRAKITFEQALSSIPRLAKAVKAQVDSVEDPPDEVTLTVGLKFTGDTSVKIVSAKAESHLNLTMKWNSEQ